MSQKNILLTFKVFCMNFSLELKKKIQVTQWPQNSLIKSSRYLWDTLYSKFNCKFIDYFAPQWSNWKLTSTFDPSSCKWLFLLCLDSVLPVTISRFWGLRCFETKKGQKMWLNTWHKMMKYELRKNWTEN